MCVVEVGCCYYLYRYVIRLVVGVLDNRVVPSIAEFVVRLLLVVVMNRKCRLCVIGKTALQRIVVSPFAKALCIVAQVELIG